MDILEYFPIILTKDAQWAKRPHKADSGSIILLPPDAILVKPQPIKDNSQEKIA